MLRERARAAGSALRQESGANFAALVKIATKRFSEPRLHAERAAMQLKRGL